jgi:hypothetical protein
MIEIRKHRDYPNSKIIAMSCLSFLCAFVMLILFIVFLASSRPSFKELSKFIFVALIIDFFLITIFGVVGFFKDSHPMTYALKVLGCTGLVAVTIFILNVIGLRKADYRALPIICLSFSLAVALMNFFVSLDFYLKDAKTPSELSILPFFTFRAIYGSAGIRSELHIGFFNREQG